MICRVPVLPYLSCVVGIVLMVGCGAPSESTRQYHFHLDIADPEQKRLLDFQDRQLRDSLVMYFRHPDPSLRYRAAMAFGSFRDSTVIGELGQLLSDPQTEVRAAAAYALGQSRARGAEPLLITAFRQHDSLPEAMLTNAAILEAVGKTGGIDNLVAMSTTTTYLATDTALVTAQARGIYRFALRNITHPSGTARMVDIVTDQAMPPDARVMAANYLFRATGINTTEFVPVLAPLAETDRDPRIRMCLVVAIAKAGTPAARMSLSRIITREEDYRVICNALRALRYFPYEQVRELAFGHLTHDNMHVARTAATYLLDHGVDYDAARYRSVSKGQYPWQVKTLLYAASNRYLQPAYAITKANLNTELRGWYQRAKDPYEKAAVLEAFAKDVRNYNEVASLAFAAKEAPVRTAAIEALGSILGDTRFARDLGAGVSNARRAITRHLVQAIQSGDAAWIASAAATIAKKENGLYDEARQHLRVFESALIALDLPAEVEAYDALADCLAKLKGETYVRQALPYNHPVSWEIVTEFPDIVKVEVVTSRGTIAMDLYTQIAPGSVVNFVQLARDRFYHGKHFHRVVPNFVIQGGCPRGDGYGGLDYSIRSELPALYYMEEGLLGMASAGNHTECTQWFITHSPTPHLDGNYTIFGKVTRGLDVLHKIQVGDVITEVNVL